MGLISYKLGQTSIVLRVLILDSSSTTGAGKTGLAFGSSGLRIAAIADNESNTAAYTAAGSTIEGITDIGVYVAPTTNKCRFDEVDDTNHPGIYELHFANARYAVNGAKYLLVSITGATNAAPCHAVVPLVSDDPYVAKPTNFNLLSIDSNGRVDVIKVAGTTQTAEDIGSLVAKFSGITSLTNWLKAMIRKSTPDATALTEIGGTYDATTDSLEASADAGVGGDATAANQTTIIDLLQSRGRS